jgi:SDR family mycofactocin-dependent oxidoreductase
MPIRPARFTDKVFFITGLARGQGRTHAVRLASEGASIIGLDRCAPVATTSYEPATEDDLAETIDQVRTAGGDIVAQVADVRDAPAVEQVLRDGVARFGRLDGVVANAAVCSYNRLWEITPEQWQETIDINLTGVWHTLRAAVPHLLASDEGGSVVVISSGAGLKALPLLGHYGATKAGVTNLAQTLAHELAPHSIRVNTIHPTAVRTPMGADASLRSVIADHPDLASAFGNLLPVSSIDPDDVADAVLWLLSEESRFVTGVALPVDAGASRR